MSEKIVKKTFADLLNETDTRRHNSNLQNLASAHVAIKDSLDKLDAERLQLVQLQQEIEAAGNDPDNLTLDQTRELYNRAYKFRD